MEKDIILQRALENYKSWTSTEEIVSFLPIIDKFCKEKFTSPIYADRELLFIQHHLGPFVPRIRTMLKYGLDPTHCWFVDIPYSTNLRVREELIKLGVPQNHMLKVFNDPIEPYSRRQIERVSYLLELIGNQESRRRLLVLDDGAYFMRTLKHLLNRKKELVMSFKERGTCIVEQTTRGHRYLEEEVEGKEILALMNFPVVSIARTNAKYELESPFIGASVSKKMNRLVQEIASTKKGLGRVLVIGYGSVGRATTRTLIKYKHDMPIHVWDKEWEKLQPEIKNNMAYPLPSFPDSGSYDCVFGCTGYASFPVDKLEILADEAFLASGSSAAIEFNREKFIDLAYHDDKDDFFIVNPEETRNNGIHAKITMQKGNKRFSFLNAGFPVNFDGQMECIPELIIQITHGLLLAASQETMLATPGFHTLNANDDNWFCEKGLYWIKKFAEQNYRV